MRIGVAKEAFAGERRVALVPETVKRFTGKGLRVVVQAGAGEGASISDSQYSDAGASVVANADALVSDSDVIVRVQPPSEQEIATLSGGKTHVSLLYPLANRERVDALAARGVTSFALDLIPRTSLAQMMDVLSSQATLAGYRAVLLAAEALPKFFPMLMTAAGTIAAARVLVIGAGVAGLQAIATARRLGAVVEAFDVRKIAKEQVESLGARFIEVDSAEDGQTTGGYAKEVSEEYKQKQSALLAEHLAKSDVCVTTALIHGKPAPVLITAEMVARMRPGTVIVDAAADQGGNCALTKPGERVTVGGVNIIGDRNLPSQMAVHASQMFSRNIDKLFSHLLGKADVAQLSAFAMNDDIARSIVVTHAGKVVAR